MVVGQFKEYRGFIGSIEYNSEDNLHHGVLLNINDLVDYSADNVIELQKEFHKAVDDYIEYCKIK